MKPGFVQSIDKEADKYGIDRSRINFEITESVAASDYDQLSQIVSELKRSGFRFSLDDYGTGYSNVMSVFSMDLDIIKIDKSILWTAVDHELGRILLENTVRMIKQMGRKVLVEASRQRRSWTSCAMSEWTICRASTSRARCQGKSSLRWWQMKSKKYNNGASNEKSISGAERSYPR